MEQQQQQQQHHHMDKGLMDLMGLEDDDEPKDLLRAPAPTDQEDPLSSSSPSNSQDISILRSKDSSSSSNTSNTSSQQSADKDTVATTSSSSQQQTLPRARTTSPFASRDDRSSAVAPPLFSPDFNPFGVPSGKIRVLKAAAKKNNNNNNNNNNINNNNNNNNNNNKAQADRGASSMFSPTLSPRKVKKRSSVLKRHPSSGFSSPKVDTPFDHVPPTRLPPPPPPTSPPPPAESRSTDLLFSPVSSFALKNPFDSDSDISPIEDNALSSLSSQPHRPIVLNASIPSFVTDMMDDDDDDEDMPSSSSSKPMIKTSSSSFLDELSDLNDKSQDSLDLDELDLDKAMGTTRLKAPSQKEVLQLQMEKEQLLRTSSLSIKKRVIKKDLSSLLKDAQANLDSKRATTPIRRFKSTTASSGKSKPLTISLDDYSEDETEQDAEKAREYAQWKLFATKALLAATIPKEKQREIMRDLKRPTILPLNKRQEIEKLLQSSPLSHDIQRLSLTGDRTSAASTFSSTSTLAPASSSSLLLAAHSQRPTTTLSQSKTKQQRSSMNSFLQFQESCRRSIAKSNMEK
ncbi:hypothetical protein BGZ65_005764, partial [Modicella reniformis]